MKSGTRDDGGQYAVTFEKLCTCGHPKGEHLAGRNGRSLGACVAGDFHAIPPCGCEAFKLAKKGGAR